MYEQIADILIPFAGPAAVALIVVILLIAVVKRIGRGNRERKQQLEELNGSIREIRDTLQAMQPDPEPEGGETPPEPAKTVVMIDNRVQMVAPTKKADLEVQDLHVPGASATAEEPEIGLVAASTEPSTVVTTEAAIAGETADEGTAVVETAVDREEEKEEPASTGVSEESKVADLTAGFRENFEKTPEEEPEDGLETVEQILAEASAEHVAEIADAEAGEPMPARVKIPVPEQPLPASLCATTAPAEAGPKLPKYMDRHQGTDKNGRTFTAEELRQQIR